MLFGTIFDGPCSHYSSWRDPVPSLAEAKGPVLLSPRLLLRALHHAQILHGVSWGLTGAQAHLFLPSCTFLPVASTKASSYKQSTEDSATLGLYRQAPIPPRGFGNEVCRGPVRAVREEENPPGTSSDISSQITHTAIPKPRAKQHRQNNHNNSTRQQSHP